MRWRKHISPTSDGCRTDQDTRVPVGRGMCSSIALKHRVEQAQREKKEQVNQSDQRTKSTLVTCSHQQGRDLRSLVAVHERDATRYDLHTRRRR